MIRRVSVTSAPRAVRLVADRTRIRILKGITLLFYQYYTANNGGLRSPLLDNHKIIKKQGFDASKAQNGVILSEDFCFDGSFIEVY